MSQTKAPGKNPEDLTDQGLVSVAQGTGQVAHPQHQLSPREKDVGFFHLRCSTVAPIIDPYTHILFFLVIRYSQDS